MNEVKTLNDISLIGYSGNVVKYREELKAEAVKWIKDCPCCKVIKIKVKDNEEPITEQKFRDFCPACLRFFVFFNLTEDNLK